MENAVKNQEERFSAISQAQEEYKVDEQEISDLIYLSTGVVLQFTPESIPMPILESISSRYEEPDPPMFEMGKGRLEPNPSDPEYQKELTRIKREQGWAFYEALIMLGTTLHSVPEGFSGPDDTDWVDQLDILGGFKVDDTREKARYLLWVRYWAATSEEDVEAIMNGSLARLGVKESDIAEAVKDFPDTAELTADNLP